MPRASPPSQSDLPSTLSRPPQHAHHYFPYPHLSSRPPYAHASRAFRPQLPANEPTAGQSTSQAYAGNTPNHQRPTSLHPGSSTGHEQPQATGGNVSLSMNPTYSYSAPSTIWAPSRQGHRFPYIEPMNQAPGPQYPTHQPASQSIPHTPVANVPNRRAWANYGQRGILGNACNFVMNNPVLIQNDIKGTDNFMKDFAERTIPGAAFDDSARDPPPRCHPGTRLAILQRAQDFLANPHRDKNMFWIVGPAGVGKSAIMQSLAENAPSANSRVVLGASLFFSINGRNDGSRTLITLAYQIAVHNSSYRQYIQKEVMNDPKLLEKLLPTQFSKFIVEPFARRLVHSSHTRFLILIDGLDECNSNDTQCELLGLISFFCLRYPTAPLVWIIASRPEPHITAYFSRTGVSSLYEMEDILINSNEGREDVERYLRYELAKLRPKYPALASIDQWPAERDFLKLSAGADGLFAFASTVVRFIDDPASGNPASQLQQVLEAIDNILSQPRYGNGHPMARLDALYSHILSRVPRHILPATKKLLLRLGFSPTPLFLYLCNRLSMTQDVAYGAIHHLHSVLYIPGPNAAARREARVLHKSFSDYLHDFERSGIFPNHTSQREELEFQCALRILDEVLDGVNGGSDPTECISLSWESHFPAGFPLIFHRQDHYQQAMSTFSKTFFRMESRDRRSLRLTHFLKAFDTELLGRSAQVISEFLSELFREDMRAELKEHQAIYEVPIGELDSNNIDGIRMWTHDPERAIEDFEHSQSHSPDQLVAVYIDIRNRSWLCHRFADPYNEGLQSADFIPYQFPPPNGT